MEEEFFFPQNVKTTYRLFAMGPRHLRRLVLGLIPILFVCILLAFRGAVRLAAIVGVMWTVVYVAGCCWPANGENTLSDLVLHIYRLRRSQTKFTREEVLPAAQIPPVVKAAASGD